MHTQKKSITKMIYIFKIFFFFFYLRNVIGTIVLNLHNHEKDDVTRLCASSAINRKDKEKYVHGKPIWDKCPWKTGKTSKTCDSHPQGAWIMWPSSQHEKAHRDDDDPTMHLAWTFHITWRVEDTSQEGNTFIFNMTVRVRIVSVRPINR